jgi:hypothetical protein
LQADAPQIYVRSPVTNALIHWAALSPSWGTPDIRATCIHRVHTRYQNAERTIHPKSLYGWAEPLYSYEYKKQADALLYILIWKKESEKE